MSTTTQSPRVRMTFAGVTFSLSPRGFVPRNAVLKILRSGKVRVTCRGRYTDDYAGDAATNFGRGELSAERISARADDIEKSPSGWRCWPKQTNLTLACHSFLYLEISASDAVTKATSG